MSHRKPVKERVEFSGRRNSICKGPGKKGALDRHGVKMVSYSIVRDEAEGMGPQHTL